MKMISHILINNFRKIVLLLAVSIIILLPVISSAANRDQIIFVFPKDEKYVFTKNDFQTIKGQIVTAKELTSAQISFDGQIWRDLNYQKAQNGYDFSYDWMVSGKGRFFIMIEAKTKDGAVIEDRLLSEVYVPPELKESGLQEMLIAYQQEQEHKQAKENKKDVTKMDTFSTVEILAEKNLGSFLKNDYLSLLPTRQQIEFFMRSTIYVYFFIKTYQAGIDIFFLLTLPLLVALTVGLFMFVYLDYLNEFFEFLYANLKINRNKLESANKKAVVFEHKSLHRVSNAKIILDNVVDHTKITTACDRDGNVDLSSVPNGEYYFEIQKNGYKPNIIEDVDLVNFLEMPVAKNNQFSVTDDCIIALPVESEIDLERKKLNDKASIFYRPKIWFLTNASSAVMVGLLVIVLYIIFINTPFSLAMMAYLSLAYLIYNSVIKRHQSWGRVYDSTTGGPATNIKIELWKNDQLFEVVWSDFDGKYSFAKLNDGIYFVKVDSRYHIVNQRCYYSGDEVVIANNTCQLKKNIMIEEATT